MHRKILIIYKKIEKKFKKVLAKFLYKSKIYHIHLGNQSGGELSTDKYLIDSRLGQTVAAVEKLSKRIIEIKRSILTTALASN